MLPSRPVPVHSRACGRARVRTTALVVPVLASLVSAGLHPLTTPAHATAPTLERVSVAGTPVPQLFSTQDPVLSRDGRYVAFVSDAPVLTGDTNGRSDVFRHDRLTGAVVRVSEGHLGGAGTGDSFAPSISANGNLVAFVSYASDLVEGDTNQFQDVFVRDVAAGKTRRVSVATGGAQAAGISLEPSISADGTAVAFTSSADDLVTEDTNSVRDVFVHTLSSRTTTRVSVDGDGNQVLGGESSDPSLSADGTQVAFLSAADGLIDNGPLPASVEKGAVSAASADVHKDVYHRNLSTRVVRLVSQRADDNAHTSGDVVLSGDGRVVAFTDRDRLTDDDTDSSLDVFAHVVATRTTTLVSGGGSGDSHTPALDEDGDTVVFLSDGDLGGSNPDARQHVYRRPLAGGAAQRLSSRPDGTPAGQDSSDPAVSGNGAVVAFASAADDLLPGDLNGTELDVLVVEDGTTTRALGLRPDPDPQSNGSTEDVDVSPDGRFVAFSGYATDLAPGVPATGWAQHVYLRDRVAGTTVLVSVDPDGRPLESESHSPSVSADGRYVAFSSFAAAVAGDTNAALDVFVRDVLTGTTRRVSVRSGDRTQAVGGDSFGPSISDDGRRVAFVSRAADLVTGDRNDKGGIGGDEDVYVHDVDARATWRMSSRPDGEGGNLRSEKAALSGDGRTVAFSSEATDLVPGSDQNAGYDVFVRDVATGATQRVSVNQDGGAAAQASTGPSLSRDGSRVAFESLAGLVPDDTDGARDVYVRQVGGTGSELLLASVADDESQTGAAGERPSLSPDGLSVAFTSQVDDLVPGAPSTRENVFVRDLAASTTRRVSSTPTGAPGNAWSYAPRMADGGRGVFVSDSDDLVPGDTNGVEDAFAFGPALPRPVPPTGPGTPGGGPVTTPTSASTGAKATAATPVQGSVTSPAGGTVAIVREPVSRPAPAGFSLLGAQVDVTAPDAAASKPLELRFRLHTSLLPAGQDLSTVLVLRNGAPAGECTGSAAAVPDPCVSEREKAGDELLLTVLTSKASDWNFVVPAGVNDSCRDAPPVPAFTDLAGNVHRGTIACATAEGITTGLTPTTYGVDRDVTRAQMAAFVARTVRAAGGTLPTGAPDAFADDQGHLFEAEINALAAAGIVGGKAPGVFDPSAVVPRDQMATFLVRAHEHVSGTELPSVPDAFDDDDASAHEESIDKAAAAGLTGGVAPRTYAPERNVRRDAMASFLVRLLASVRTGG